MPVRLRLTLMEVRADLQQWGTFFSAGAAAIAATLAGVDLYLTGRRDQLNWTRSALESACVDFLTANCDTHEACREIARLREGPRAADFQFRGVLLDRRGPCDGADAMLRMDRWA